MARPSSLAILSVALLAIGLAGCSEDPEGVTPPQDGEGRYVIRMTDSLTFDPPMARVPAGATVVWRNDAAVDHDVAGYRGDPVEEDVEAFSSYNPPPDGLGGPIGPGGEFGQEFAEAGAWTIWCHLHHEERMTGVVHVG